MGNYEMLIIARPRRRAKSISVELWRMDGCIGAAPLDRSMKLSISEFVQRRWIFYLPKLPGGHCPSQPWPLSACTACSIRTLLAVPGVSR
jgi:hypothetical protein